MSQDPLNTNVVGPLDALKADKAALEVDFAILHAKADAHAVAIQDLKKAVVATILELVKVVGELIKMTVKRSA
jgi:hypothetical protein